MRSDLTFSSDDACLVDGFAWAKTQAFQYVFTGDPVGDWYEAALPGRAAFCMRDVSHQAAGAHLLGLARFNRNMLRRFAENITGERGWCSYWEIDHRNQPCPTDYRDDSYFWYNLPANFDVLHCCMRMYLCTGDRVYLDDPVFRFFYAKTINEYVRAWDKDGNGLMEHYPAYGFRGIATYNEDVDHPLVGGDLVAAQYAGYRTYAELLDMEGRSAEAEAFRVKAGALRMLFNQHWWDAENKQFYGFLDQQSKFVSDPHGLSGLFALYFDLVDTPEQVRLTLDQLIAHEATANVETRSYLPEILYRYGRVEAADQLLRVLFEPGLARREYPELAFALIGALGSGLMGLHPDVRERMVTTLPRLAPGTGWAELSHVPVFEHRLSIRHTGLAETRLAAGLGRPFFWRAAFPGQHAALEFDGRLFPAYQSQGPGGQWQSFGYLHVAGGETHTARIP